MIYSYTIRTMSFKISNKIRDLQFVCASESAMSSYVVSCSCCTPSERHGSFVARAVIGETQAVCQDSFHCQGGLAVNRAVRNFQIVEKHTAANTYRFL